MTFIQPKKHLNIENIIIAALVLFVLVGTFGIIVEYNKTVDLNHNILAAKTEIQQIGMENTQLNNEVLATLNTDQAAQLAASDGLVAENKPQYVSINQEWPIASQ
jgi:cell division protein FtsL